MVLISGLAALFTLAVTGTMIGLAENDRKKRLEIQFCPYPSYLLSENITFFTDIFETKLGSIICKNTCFSFFKEEEICLCHALSNFQNQLIN